MQELANFYESFYLPGTSYTPEDLEVYLQSISFPEPTATKRQTLDDPLTIEELQEAVSSFSNCKAPGQDGIPIEIYKQYSEV